MDILIDEDADGGSDGRGDVVADAIVTDALRASRRGEHVDGHCAVSHCRGAEGSAVQRSDHSEEQQRTGQQIAAKADEIEQQTNHQHPFPWKTVHDETAEGPDEQGRQCIARQHQTYHVFCRTKGFAQIQRQQRRKQIEGKRHREVRSHHLPIVAVPQAFTLFHLQSFFSVSKDTTLFEHLQTKDKEKTGAGSN